MIDLLSLNKTSIITSICLAIVSLYLLKKLIFRQFIHVKTDYSREVDDNDNDDDDDIPFRSNIDKRSLRTSYARFMRRQLQQESNNDSCSCIICWNEKKTVVLLPCRHLCVCVACSRKLCNDNQRATCPICRNEVNNLLVVFV